MKKLLSRKWLILISFFIIIVLAILIVNIKNNYDLEKMEAAKSEHYPEPELSYTNNVSDVYEGYISSYKISSSIKILFESYLPMISGDIMNKTEDELKSYYEVENDLINYNLGSSTEEEFIDFATKIQKVDCSLEDVSSIFFVTDSYNKNNGEESFDFKITYSNGNSIDCTAYITGSDSDLKIRVVIK